MKKIVLSLTFFSLAIILISQSHVWAKDYNSYIDDGNRLWAENKIMEAQSAFENAIKLDPKASMGHSRLAGLLLANNQNKKAIKAYQSAINADPKNPTLFIAIGIAYLHEQSYGMAQEMVKQALILDPEHLNGKKLQEYVDRKMEIIAQADQQGKSKDPIPKAYTPKDSIHQKVDK